MPETKRHLELRTLLYTILKHSFGSVAHIGSEQFVYYRAADPRRCVAPDAFVRRGGPDSPFDTWKTWERGAPELCVEIASTSDERGWDDKLSAYHDMGVLELVLFDADAEPGSRLRVWDRVEEDLVERVVEADRSRSTVLQCTWVVRAIEAYPAALRLEDDHGEPLPTPTEAEARARDAAERRVAELEAELRRREGKT